MMPVIPKIHDYAVIGDGRSAALVSRTGSLDWLCWPRFDSPSLFAGLLDQGVGGTWSIGPTETARVARCSLTDTNVLQTRFLTAGGVLVLTDFMPAASEQEKKRMLWTEQELVRHNPAPAQGPAPGGCLIGFIGMQLPWPFAGATPGRLIGARVSRVGINI